MVNVRPLRDCAAAVTWIGAWSAIPGVHWKGFVHMLVRIQWGVTGSKAFWRSDDLTMVHDTQNWRGSRPSPSSGTERSRTQRFRNWICIRPHVLGGRRILCWVPSKELTSITWWQWKSVFFRLRVTANVVPSSPILVTLIMEAIRSSETSVLTRATWRNNPGYGILHSHRCENVKSYITLTWWVL
jgi:hypothetical protein